MTDPVKQDLKWSTAAHVMLMLATIDGLGDARMVSLVDKQVSRTEITAHDDGRVEIVLHP